MNGFVLVATRPDGKVTRYGAEENVPFPTRESAEAYTREPLQGERLESEWECVVEPWNGEELVGLPE